MWLTIRAGMGRLDYCHYNKGSFIGMSGCDRWVCHHRFSQHDGANVSC